MKDNKLQKAFKFSDFKEAKFSDFKEAMQFVNTVADIAENAGHHPDIYISYNKVEIILWTHAIGGLSLNDFIVAARIEEMESATIRG